MFDDGQSGGAGRSDSAVAGQDAVVLARLTELGREIDRLEAERCRLLAAAGRSGVLERDGARTAAAWLRSHSSLTAAQASVRAKVARRLPDVPALAAAFDDGRIGVGHVRQVDLLARDVGVERVTAVDEELLAVAERIGDLDAFRRVCRSWQHALMPDALDERDARAHAARRLSLAPTFDGVVHGEMVLDAEGGATVMAAIDALATPDGPDVPADARRTREQRRADALVELSRRALEAGDLPTVGGERPHVVVRVDLADLVGRGDVVGQVAGQGPDRTPRPPSIDGVGEVGPATARRIAGDATLVRIVLGAASQPLDVGTATRMWPAAIRRAITERDRDCRFPGCDRPPAWCDIDHVDEVAESHGPTAVSNGILLCRPHHRAKRRDRWWPTLLGDGAVVWSHADGRRRIDYPPSRITGAVQGLLEADADPPTSGVAHRPDLATDERAAYTVVSGAASGGRPDRSDSRASPGQVALSHALQTPVVSLASGGRCDRDAARRRPPPSATAGRPGRRPGRDERPPRRRRPADRRSGS